MKKPLTTLTLGALAGPMLLPPGGGLVPNVDRCTPRVRKWRLRPGDVVVLCSDGLVEEGVFLEPRLGFGRSAQGRISRIPGA